MLFVVSEDENMATIARIKRVNGVSYQAKIKCRGRVIQTNTFRTKTSARIENVGSTQHKAAVWER